MQGISAWVPIFNCKKIEIIPCIRPKYYVYHNNRQVVTFGRSKSSLSCLTIEETTSPVLMCFFFVECFDTVMTSTGERLLNDIDLKYGCLLPF